MGLAFEVCQSNAILSLESIMLLMTIIAGATRKKDTFYICLSVCKLVVNWHVYLTHKIKIFKLNNP